MGICYVSKTQQQQVVVNNKLVKEPQKEESKTKSKLIVVKQNQLIELKTKIRQSYYSNSLMNLSFSSFKAILKEAKKEKILLKQITYFLTHIQFSIIEEGALKDIMIMSSSKLSIIFPKQKIFKLICKMIFFLLSKKTIETNKKRKKFINKLLNYAKVSLDDEYYNEQNESLIKNMVKASIYSTKKLTLIIINLLLFLSYFSIYFFIIPNIFQIFYNLDENKTKELLVDKLDIEMIQQKDIESIVSYIIKFINPNFSRNLFMIHSIYYICSPLKNYILNHPTQKIFI